MTIRLHECNTCGACNPTDWDDPKPASCVSCGMPLHTLAARATQEAETERMTLPVFNGSTEVCE